MGRSVFLVLALVGAFATVFVAVAVVGVYQLGRDDRPAYVASGPAGERPAAPKSTATSPAVEWKLRDGAHLDRAAAGSLAPTGASPATELPAVMALTVVDAEGLAPLVPLTDGMTFDPAALAAREISVRADVKGKVGSVRFVLDGASHLEGAPPYTIAGDGGGRAVAWRPGFGVHTLVVTPFGGPDGTGDEGTPTTFRFTVDHARDAIVLPVAEATLHGPGVKLIGVGAERNASFWRDAANAAAWTLDRSRPGQFKVEIVYACSALDGGGEFQLVAGDQSLGGPVTPTRNWQDFQAIEVGTINLPSGPTQITVKTKALADNRALWKLRALRLIPVRS